MTKQELEEKLLKLRALYLLYPENRKLIECRASLLKTGYKKYNRSNSEIVTAAEKIFNAV